MSEFKQLNFGFVESYVDSGLAVLTMTDSAGGNRLNTESLSSLSSAFNNALMDDGVRVILLRSNGKNFCLGMDLVFLQNVDGDRTVGEETVGMYVDLLLKIYEAPKPVIALVNGDVKAGGMGLVGACDIIVASEHSTFELSEVLLGLIPANVLPFVFALRIKPQKARYLIMTAKRLTASEAKSEGLVDEVYPIEELEKQLKSLIKGLFRAAPHAVAETKHFTQAILSKNMDEASNLAKDKILEMIGMPEVREGIAAFNEGGIPPWFGKFKPEKPLVIEENHER